MFVQPDTRPISDKEFELQSDYTADIIRNGVHLQIIVPKGFKTDLASIPRILWTISGMDPDGLYRGAAVVHDYLYSMKVKGAPFSAVLTKLPTGTITKLAYTREQCDDIFSQVMRQAGEEESKIHIMWQAVRTFGWLYYRDKKSK